MSSGSIADFKKRRSWLRITESILSICVEGRKTTQVVYGSNIAFPRFKKYSSFLIEKGLLEALEGEEGKIFKTTEKGLRFLKLMDELTLLLEEEGP